MRRFPLVIACALACATAMSAVAGPAGATGSSATVVVVGDIAFAADSPTAPQRKTATLANALHPDRLLLIGDLAYGHKSAGRWQPTSKTEFRKKLLPSWGTLLKSSWLVPGNHETYGSGKGVGYRWLVKSLKPYGVPQATKKGDLWWSRTITTGSAKWLVLGLDSEGLANKAKRTRETQFIAATLAANAGKPTIVMWHRPRYTSGEHGDQTDVGVQALWNAVKSDNDVVLVLWGHDHDYESRAVDVAGRTHPLQTLVVGTGGAELRGCPGQSDPVTTPSLVCGSASSSFQNYGVVKLVLDASGYAWEYRQVGSGGTGTVAASGSYSLN